jgi:UDP-2,3-diacylglucosamine pyrophosphatase LpxH
VQKLLKRVPKHTGHLYPGNHDEFARDYVGDNFGGIEITGTAIHEGLYGNGR